MPFELLASTPWPGIVTWTGLYCSDWVLTQICARLYRAQVANTIVLEGSYEITPFYQADVDAFRRISPRFVVVLGLSAMFVWWVWATASLVFYAFMLGALVCVELVVHVRHLRNLFLFRAIAAGRAVRGRIEYSRDLLLAASSFEIVTFSGLFIIVFAFTGSPFVLGGAVASLWLAVQHWWLARKQAIGQRNAS